MVLKMFFAETIPILLKTIMVVLLKEVLLKESSFPKRFLLQVILMKQMSVVGPPVGLLNFEC
jgi:hypothetical protein